MCAPHFILSWPIARRAITTATVVGTVLLAINQGDLILSGDPPAALWWKVPLTYAVPYTVTTWGALAGGRLDLGRARSRPARDERSR